MAVSVPLPLRLNGIWLSLGDAASFSFPVAELMRFSSPCIVWKKSVVWLLILGVSMEL